jgi:methionine synthase II (cobalamin-independent)
MPRIVGPIRRMHPVEVDDLKFLKRHTGRQVKMTVPGPFTMSQQAQNDFYPNPAEAAMDYAVAVNEEIRDLFAAGADIVQVDEPCMQRVTTLRQKATLNERWPSRDGKVQRPLTHLLQFAWVDVA